MAGKRAAQSRQTDLYDLHNARSLLPLMYSMSQVVIIVVAVSRRLPSNVGAVGMGWSHDIILLKSCGMAKPNVLFRFSYGMHCDDDSNKKKKRPKAYGGATRTFREVIPLLPHRVTRKRAGGGAETPTESHPGEHVTWSSTGRRWTRNCSGRSALSDGPKTITIRDRSSRLPYWEQGTEKLWGIRQCNQSDYPIL